MIRLFSRAKIEPIALILQAIIQVGAEKLYPPKATPKNEPSSTNENLTSPSAHEPPPSKINNHR